MDGLVPCERDSPKPGAEVLQDHLLRGDLDCFFAVEHHGRLDECLLEDKLIQFWLFESIQKMKVKLMVVGLRADSLVNQIIGEPLCISIIKVVLHLHKFCVEVTGRKVVHNE